MPFVERLHSELERRLALTRAIDASLEKLFIFDPSNRKLRLRRNQVHHAIFESWGLPPSGNWRPKKLITERLIKKGVRKVLSQGNRYFVGIGFKDESNVG